MNKCPRCKNQEVREEYNFCKICGLDLRPITRDEAISQLHSLIQESEYHMRYKDFEEVFYRDKLALKYAIKELEKTAQEVPVQEQYVTLKIEGLEIDGLEIAKVVIDEIRKQQKSEIRIIPV